MGVPDLCRPAGDIAFIDLGGGSASATGSTAGTSGGTGGAATATLSFGDAAMADAWAGTSWAAAEATHLVRGPPVFIGVEPHMCEPAVQRNRGLYSYV